MVDNINSASSTLCSFGLGGITTYTLTATTYGSTISLTNSARHANAFPGSKSGLPEPIAWWKMDEGSGTTSADLTGHGNTLTLGDGAGNNTPTWTTGLTGSGLLFTAASSQYASFPSISITTGVTLIAWVKYTASTGTTQALFGDATTTILGGNGNTIYIPNNSGAVGLTISNGNWYMEATSIDITNQTAFIYKNDIVMMPGFGSIGATNLLYLGKNGTPQHYLNGELDEVRIYNVPLSVPQVQEIYREYNGESGGRGGCGIGYMYCSNSCVHLLSSTTNCGNCGTACLVAAGQTCAGGKCCTAATPDTCPAGCKNLQTDNSNCGYCSNACGGGTPNCVAGVCT